MILNKSGVRRLASAVIEQACDDYIDCARSMIAIKDPFKNGNTFTKYNLLFNAMCNRVSSEDRKRGWKKKGETNDDFYAYIVDRLNEYYYVKAESFIDISDFFNSDRFLVYARNIDGKQVERELQSRIKEWATTT